MKLDFSVCGDPTRRHDFILVFDVLNGNPNGDPDMDNTPRQDLETNHGLVTDVCLKRKVRNYVSLQCVDDPGCQIYVQDKGYYLNDLHRKAQQEAGIPEDRAKEPRPEELADVRSRMCRRYYDVRMFGAVMSTRVNAGQVRGPLQMTFARSADPVQPMDISITRVALTDEAEKQAAARAEKAEEEGGAEQQRYARTGTMGRKVILPYGLYIGHGFFTPAFAKQTGVSRADLELFWNALTMMWDLDHSAARGLMSIRGLYVFSHTNPLGDAPAYKLFEKLETRLKDGVSVPRRFSDYAVTIDRDLPEGVTLTSLAD